MIFILTLISTISEALLAVDVHWLGLWSYYIVWSNAEVWPTYAHIRGQTETWSLNWNNDLDYIADLTILSYFQVHLKFFFGRPIIFEASKKLHVDILP